MLSQTEVFRQSKVGQTKGGPLAARPASGESWGTYSRRFSSTRPGRPSSATSRPSSTALPCRWRYGGSCSSRTKCRTVGCRTDGGRLMSLRPPLRLRLGGRVYRRNASGVFPLPRGILASAAASHARGLGNRLSQRGRRHNATNGWHATMGR